MEPLEPAPLPSKQVVAGSSPAGPTKLESVAYISFRNHGKTRFLAHFGRFFGYPVRVYRLWERQRFHCLAFRRHPNV
jgi:hypothetical protein